MTVNRPDGSLVSVSSSQAYQLHSRAGTQPIPGTITTRCNSIDCNNQNQNDRHCQLVSLSSKHIFYWVSCPADGVQWSVLSVRKRLRRILQSQSCLLLTDFLLGRFKVVPPTMKFSPTVHRANDVGYPRTQIGVFLETIRTQTDPATLVDGSK